MGKATISIVVLIFIMSIYPPVNGSYNEQLKETQLLFSSHGTESGNLSGCTNTSASNYNQNATEDDGSCIHQSKGGFEISESIFDEGLISGLKFNPNGDKYAILQYKFEEDNMNSVPKIIVVPTDNNESMNTTEVQLSEFDSGPIDFDWSPDGKQFVVMFRNMEVITFDSETGNVSDYLFDLNNSVCQSCNNNVNYGEISYNHDGRLISVMAKYSERIYLDDLSYGFVINTSTKEIVKVFSREYGPSTGTWSPDGSQFAFQSSYSLNWIVFFNTSTWETTELNFVYDERLLSMDYSSNGEFIALCSLDKLYVYNTSTLAKIWVSDVSNCLDIDWSSNTDYVGVTQSYNYGWWLTSQSGPYDWEWYSDGGSITIYNSSTGEIVDRLTTGNGDVCAYCDYIDFFEWHPSSNYIISSGPVFEMDKPNSYPRIDFWVYNESIIVTFGCMEMYSVNFNPNATRSDGSCIEFDEQDVNQIREEGYYYTDEIYFYDTYWDFCEWDESEGEFLCWVEDLSVLSEDAIDDLEVCDQSENGCETEPYCEETIDGLWGCFSSFSNYQDTPTDDDDQKFFSGMVDDFGEILFLLIVIIIVCIIVVIYVNRGNTKLSSDFVDDGQNYMINEEHNSTIPPKGFEINIRDLK